RAIAAIYKCQQLENGKEAFEKAHLSDASKEKVLKQFIKSQEELVMEIKDIEREAKHVKSDWNQTIMNTAREIVRADLIKKSKAEQKANQEKQAQRAKVEAEAAQQRKEREEKRRQEQEQQRQAEKLRRDERRAQKAFEELMKEEERESQAKHRS